MRALFCLAFMLSACGSPHGLTPDAGADGAVPDADPCTGGTLCGSPAACCPAGNECVEDRCVAACSTGVRCGAALDTCCAAGEVCLSDACVTPGTACADPYDCEPGNFCEPSLGQCLPQHVCPSAHTRSPHTVRPSLGQPAVATNKTSGNQRCIVVDDNNDVFVARANRASPCDGAR